MKKFRMIILSICLMLSSTIFFACGENEQTIDVENIWIEYNGEVVLDFVEIPLGESMDFEVKYSPENSTSAEINLLSYDEDVVTILQNEENPLFFTVTAPEEMPVATNTTFAVGLKNDVTIQALLDVKLIDIASPLDAPTDVFYNETENRIEWSYANAIVESEDLRNFTVDINGVQYITNANYLDFSNFAEYDTEFVVKVKANAKYHYNDSAFSNIYKFTKLNQVQNVNHKDFVISWDMNELADNYIVCINNTEITESDELTDLFVYDYENKKVSFDATEYLQDVNNYAIKIVAVSNENNVFKSDDSNIIYVQKLRTPTFTINSYTICWTMIEDATSYSIDIYKVEEENSLIKNVLIDNIENSTSYEYKLTNNFIDNLEDGTYQIVLSAVGNGETTITSAKTSMKEVVKLPTPTINITDIVLDGATQSVLIWDNNSLIDDTLKFNLYQNDRVIPVHSNIYTLDSSFSAGAYTFKVQSLGNGSNVFRSNISDEIQVLKLSAPELSSFTFDSKTNILSFTSNYALSYEVLVNGSIISIDAVDITLGELENSKKGEVDLSEFSAVNNKFEIKVKAKGGSESNNVYAGFVDSEYSSTFVVNKIETPQFSVNEGELSWNRVNYATNYVLSFYSAQNLQSKLFSLDLNTITNYSIVENSTCSYDETNDRYCYTLVVNGIEYVLYSEVSYYLTIKALGTTDNLTNSYYYNSDISDFFEIQLLKTPTLTIIDGELLLNEVNNATKYYFEIYSTKTNQYSKKLYDENINEYLKSNFGGQTIKISVSTIGTENTINQQTNYVNSAKSNEREFYQFELIESTKIENGILSFNEIHVKKSDNSNVNVKYILEYGFIQQSGETAYFKEIEVYNGYEDDAEILDDGKICHSISNIVEYYLNNFSQNANINEQNLSFAVRVKAVSDNLYTLENNFSISQTFIKLQTPQLEVSNYEYLFNENIYNDYNFDLIPGMLTWNRINRASNYSLKIYKNLENSKELIYEQISSNIRYRLPDELIDESISYSFVLEALGNGYNIVNSEKFELNNIKVLNAPQINVNGNISWTSEYSCNYSPFSFEGIIFVIEINDGNEESTYLPYDLSYLDNGVSVQAVISVLQSLTYEQESSLKKYGFEFPDELSAKTGYEIAMYIVPINFSSNYLISKRTKIGEIENNQSVEKLTAPKNIYFNDGQLYFSKVFDKNGIEASSYELYVTNNGETNKIDDFNYVEYSQNEYVYDFALNYGNLPGDYSVQIKTISNQNNVVHSSLSNEVLVTVLDASSLYISEGVLSWTKIENVTHYELTILDESGNVYKPDNRPAEYIDGYVDIIINNSIHNFEFNVPFASGKYTVKLKAKGDGVRYITNKNIDTEQSIFEDSVVIKEVYKLETPTDLHIEKGKLVWNGETNVQYYNLISKKSGYNDTIKRLGNKTSYELSNEFTTGNYSSVKIQAMGASLYLNSEISKNINTADKTYKLANPVLSIVDGKLTWNCDDRNLLSYYELTISGSSIAGKYIIGKDISSLDLSGVENGFLTYALQENFDGEGNLESVELIQDRWLEIEAGFSGSIYLQAIGSYRSFGISEHNEIDEVNIYLNSDLIEIKVYILSNVTNVRVEKGVLTWTNPTDTMSGDLTLVYSNDKGTFNAVVTGKNTYIFEDEGEYDIHFENLGNNSNLITSKPTDVYKVYKLESPLNVPTIESDEDGIVTLTVDLNENASGYRYCIEYKLEGINNAKIYDSSENYINYKIEITTEYGVTKYRMIINNDTNNSFDISGTYSIKVQYIGGTEILNKDSVSYLNSEYGEKIDATIPNAPILNAKNVEGSKIFTGEIYWKPVSYETITGETKIVDSYRITYYYLNSTQNQTYESVDYIKANGIKNAVTKTDSKFYVLAKGYYLVYAESFVEASGSYSNISQPVLVYYSMYNNGAGTVDDPYQIYDVYDYLNIKYNLTAHYKVMEDLDFSVEKDLITIIGDINNEFVGSLDGNNKTFENITISNLDVENVALFAVLGNGSIVKNLTIKNIIISSGSCVGAITGYNHGTIQNCTVTNFKVSSLKTIYAGAIAGINYNEIKDSNAVNVSINYGYYVGGITGYNINKDSQVLKCNVYNTSDESYFLGVAVVKIIMDVYTGGIVGFNHGTIDLCDNNVIINPTYNNTDGFSVYSGGIAGVNSLTGIISNSKNNGTIGIYNINSDYLISCYSGGISGRNLGNIYSCGNEGIVSAQASSQSISVQNSYAGGIVGYNGESARVSHCYNKAEVFADCLLTNRYAYVGGIVGYNAGKGNTEDTRSISYCVVLRNDADSELNIHANKTQSGSVYVGFIAGYNETQYSMINIYYDNGIELYLQYLISNAVLGRTELNSTIGGGYTCRNLIAYDNDYLNGIATLNGKLITEFLNVNEEIWKTENNKLILYFEAK